MTNHSPIGRSHTAPVSVPSAPASGCSPVPEVGASFPCRECNGEGEAEYMALTEDRYHWRECHECGGSGVEAPYCLTCEGKLTVDGFCYDCDAYEEFALTFVERIAPGRVAL